ncbi:MAG: dissimilatory-type sulfite reductase subunit alpha [Deltaproteobacteria bacterium]|jgi:dissimilatory sulfite reductase alpha subunit|nr:dissimilatory-type sulfite reductase subunit alpha [Deltaproteobacteria bacterium]MBT4087236.1 dissimilatory-type sulfite reductase subunit alpha [Deltaproteobacteria bacterium]MBT4266989.1 dissimilatory-type sulfite reductase subunit alpha [Deltaproteobacteria bacterium]MBT4639710.1 dissimilatory-type sulfite reductase subunit alpha [Deltaproteobacteria bacterium]MBT6504175.1 dissimilatory-type sulfite reductase subunit alpha [Deltaproteobacteria bacterium]
MSDTPMMDELEKGPWPSFVREIRRAGKQSATARDLINILELSYKDKKTHWKHGGVVGVRGYGAGVIGRYVDDPVQFPGVAHFHTVRVNQTSGFVYNTKGLGEIMDIWDKRGSGMTNMHGSTGDLVLLGTTSEQLDPIFTDISQKGWDLGGSGSDLRTPSCCLGPARCEYACIDTLAITRECTNYYQDELHRPAFPYKFKIKVAGCSNDCVASIARSDLSIIGTWKDDIRIDQDEIANYVKGGGIDIMKEVVMMCPTQCIDFDGTKMEIDNSNCVHCMHCINKLTKALRVGTDQGATILLGAKAPIVEGAMLASVIVPFMKLEEPFENLKELIEALWEVWDEDGKNKERIGEFMERMGKGEFVEAVGEQLADGECGIEMTSQIDMINHPRENPYIFYDEYLEEEG